MTTETDIANRALGAAGTRSTIANLWAENSAEARLCRLLYRPTRDALLRAAHWNFTRKTGYLTLIKSAPGTPENPTGGSATWTPAYPPPPWLYSYAVPEDSVLLRYITPQVQTGATQGLPIFSAPSYVGVPCVSIQPVRFQVANDTDTQGNEAVVALTNQEQALGVWTRRVENPALWDAMFEEAMVAALASRLIIPLSGDKALRRDQVQLARDALAQARLSDGDEGLTIQEHVPDWIRTRGFAGDWPTGSYFVGMWSDPSFLAI